MKAMMAVSEIVLCAVVAALAGCGSTDNDGPEAGTQEREAFDAEVHVAVDIEAPGEPVFPGRVTSIESRVINLWTEPLYVRPAMSLSWGFVQYARLPGQPHFKWRTLSHGIFNVDTFDGTLRALQPGTSLAVTTDVLPNKECDAVVVNLRYQVGPSETELRWLHRNVVLLVELPPPDGMQIRGRD